MQIVISSVEVKDTETGVTLHCVRFNKAFFLLIKAPANLKILSASHPSV